LRVNGQDVQAILSNQSPGANTAPVTNIYDVNRDGRVNGQDRIVLLGNQQAGGIVAPITVPSQPSAVPATQAGDGFTPATVISITSGIQNNPSRPEHGKISTSVFSVSSKIPPFVELAIRLEVAHAANLVPSFEAKQPDKSLS